MGYDILKYYISWYVMLYLYLVYPKKIKILYFNI